MVRGRARTPLSPGGSGSPTHWSLRSLRSCVLLRSMNPEYITTTEAARLLGVTAQTIRNWIRSGKITTEPTMGGHNRIPVAQPVISEATSVTVQPEPAA